MNEIPDGDNSTEPAPNIAVSSVDQTEADFLAQGTRALAGNLVKLLEIEDPAEAEAYLTDVIAETGSSLPPAERAAAFAALSAEQRIVIRERLLESGGKLLDRIEENDRVKLGKLPETNHRAKRSLDNVAEIHEFEVARHLRSTGDTRRAARGQVEADQAARHAGRVAGEHVGAIDAWARAQGDALHGFGDELNNARRGEVALSQAQATLKPGYEGKPVDLSTAVSKETIAKVAQKIQAAALEARQANGDVNAAIEAALSAEPTVSPAEVARLIKFAERYSGFARAVVSKVRSGHSGVTEGLSMFNRAGGNYEYIRSVDEALDAHRVQRSGLELAQRGGDILFGSDQQILSESSSLLASARQNSN